MHILYALDDLIAVTQAEQFPKHVPVHVKIKAGQIIISVTNLD